MSWPLYTPHASLRVPAKVQSAWLRAVAAAAAALACLCAAGPASAQWTRVTAVPPFDVFSLFARGDTIVAGVDTAVYVSTNAGSTWQVSAKVGPLVGSVDALWLRNGQLYAGTYGHGVFYSANLGGSWTPRSSGLGSSYVGDFEVRGDRLFAATDGAGVYSLDLSNPIAWQQFGTVPQDNQASGILELAISTARMLAVGGANGQVFWNDPLMTDWSVTHLNNVGLVPGLQPYGVTWTGTRWIVATNVGCFRSLDGDQAWQYVGPPLGTVLETQFALLPPRVFAAVNKGANVHFYTTGDDGAHWQAMEATSNYVYELAMVDTTLYAGRLDGLWKRAISTTSVPGNGTLANGLDLALASAHPIRNRARLRWTLPTAARATLEVFDLKGRRVARILDRGLDAGPHEAEWEPRVAPGVHWIRLSAEGRTSALRVVVVK